MKIILLVIFSLISFTTIFSQELNCEVISNNFIAITHYAANDSNVFFIGCTYGDDDCEIYYTNGTSISKIHIIPGSNQSYPNSLVNFQNTIFFSARNITGQRVIFKIVPPSSLVVVDEPNNFGRLNVVNNRLYFTSADDKGTPRAQVKLNTDPGYFNFAQYSTPSERYFQCQNNIIFNSDNGLGLNVQISAGLPGSRSYIQTNFTNGVSFTPYNNKVYFTAAINGYGSKLCYTDCSLDRSATKLINFNMNSTNFKFLTVFNNFLYFTVSNTSEMNLYKIDTSNTITKVSNLTNIYDLYVFGSRLYFNSVNFDTQEIVLYNLDYQDNIRLVRNNFTSVPHFTTFGNTMYFTCRGVGVGEELFGISIFDPETVFLAIDINLGTNSSESFNFFVHQNNFYFQANYPSNSFYSCTKASSSALPTSVPPTISPTTIEPTIQTSTPTVVATSTQTNTTGDITVNISGKAKKKEEWPIWSIAMCAVAGGFIILSIIVLVTLNMKF
eukprot:TRINITY_DN7141_c0_g1_i1.p1 TRINITY_DN7141_c0_g1~~TRINITY_DN7141_c0_g1_i1.p1  ORF type:complete len:498 (-),score=95.76 TRINITY_DN7141_c0_g1_i1:81-1574(-)